jgi:hypothetical protein
MYKITYENAKNRVYVMVEGSLTINEIPQYNADFKAAVDKAKTGFTVCVDNTNAGVNTPEVNEKLVISRDYAMSKGLRNSAMIVNSAVFKMQMKRVFKELGNVFENIAEADKFLDTAPDIRTQM